MTTGMRATLSPAAVCLLCLGLAACGGSSSSSSNRQQIEHVITSMESAMAKGDYAGAFSALIRTAGVSKAQLAKAFGGGQAPKITSVSVHGNQATITYTATENGKTFTETDGLVREGGTWKADHTISRHNGG